MDEILKALEILRAATPIAEAEEPILAASFRWSAPKITYRTGAPRSPLK